MEPSDDLAPAARIREKLDQARTRPKGAQEKSAAAVLRERAGKLAQEPPAPEEGDILEVVEFRLGKERLAFEAAWVKEVFIPRSIVKVPCTPSFVAGIINMRGSILSVIDLRLVLDLPETEEDAKAALLLSDGEMEFGILVGEIECTRTVFHHDIKAPLPTVSEKAKHFLRGILPGAVSLLDARLLLASPQMRIYQGESTN